MTLHDKIRSVFKDRITVATSSETSLTGTPEEIIAEIAAIVEKHGKN